MRWILTILISILAICIAIIPEVGMYIFYHAVGPTSEAGRIAMGGILLWFGVGLSFLFAVLGTVLWFAFVTAAWEVYPKHRRRW